MAAAVLEACPDPEWQLIFALSRFGGLRCPSEHLALRLIDIDWERDRLTVHSPKTKKYEGKESRVVPIFPELKPYLEAVWFAAEPGTEYVINRYRDTNSNLRTQLQRILKRAGLEPWPKLFQNLRSTRETELSAEYPIHVVCAWIGNSPRVAQAHYLQVTETDFQRAATTRGAECGAPAASQAAQNQAQPRSAVNRDDTHTGRNPLFGKGLRPLTANRGETLRMVVIPPAGLEPATPGLGNRCSIH